MMRAQRDAGLLKPGSDAMRARVGKEPELNSPITLSEVGINFRASRRVRRQIAAEGAVLGIDVKTGTDELV